MICWKIFKYKVLIYDISSFSSAMLPASEQVVLYTDHMQSYSLPAGASVFLTISQTMHFINLRRDDEEAAWYYLWFQNIPIMCSTEKPTPCGSINVISKPDLHLLEVTSEVVSCSISSGWETSRGM